MQAAVRAALLCVAVAIPTRAQNPSEAGPDGPLAPNQSVVLPGVEQLRIGGQYRLRFEDRINYDFGADESIDDDFFVQRVRINLDFQIDEDHRVFVQLQDARFWGEEAGVTIDRSSPGLDLHQAWFEVGDVGLIGGDTRIGRQLLSYGDERVVGPLDWLNQGRSFNAFRHRWEADADEGAWSVDLFGAQLSETPRTTMNEDDAVFVGAYGTLDAGDDGDVVDAYAFLLQDDETTNSGTEARVTLGLRALQHLGDVELGVEAATQFGEVDDHDIPIGATYAVHVHAKVPLGEARAPWLRVEFDAASGDDASTEDVERFDNLFPTAHKFLGIMDLVLWENILHAGAQIGVPTSGDSRLTLSGHLFRAMEETDRVGGPAGALTTGGTGFSKDLGTEIDLVWHQDLPVAESSYATHVELGYGLFIPGDAVRDSFASDELAHFVYVQGGIVF